MKTEQQHGSSITAVKIDMQPGFSYIMIMKLSYGTATYKRVEQNWTQNLGTLNLLQQGFK